MTKHLRLIMLSLLAMICMGGYSQSEETPLFYESFNTNNGAGGNDGKFSGTTNLTPDYDKSGWSGKNVNGANKCVKIGVKTTQGSITTPTIKINTKCLLSFKAAAWNNKDDKTQINVSISTGQLTYGKETKQKVTINNLKKTA